MILQHYHFPTFMTSIGQISGYTMIMNHHISCTFLYIKPFMLGIIMQLGVSLRLTPQVTTIICYHMKKVLLKKNTKIWGTRPKITC